MIIYRPAVGGLLESLDRAREFNSISGMKSHIVLEHTNEKFGAAFSEEDIVFGDKIVVDERIGWNDVRYVCVKKYYQKDYIEMYGVPQCIGMFATDYKKL